MLQRDGMVMVEMKVLVMEMMMMMMMMMIPMKSGEMMMTMVTISPLREGISPGRFLPTGELFFLWCFPPSRGGGVYL
jgi:hypothetical protein